MKHLLACLIGTICAYYASRRLIRYLDEDTWTMAFEGWMEPKPRKLV